MGWTQGVAICESSSGSGGAQVACYNLYGSTALTIPSWATSARVGIMGAGGGGAGSNTATDRVSGGAGGGYVYGVSAYGTELGW